MNDCKSAAGGSIEEFLNCQVFAVAGVSSNEKKFGTQVYRVLLKAGKRTFGVNPRLAELDGQRIYPDLESLPEPPEVLVSVVPSKIGLALAHEALALGVRRIWMQPGAESEELLRFCRDNSICAIHNECVLREM